MERHPHLLTPNKQTFKPSLHIFFDIETDVGDFEENWREHRFKLGWALFWRRESKDRKDNLEWYEIEDKEGFWEWVEKHARSKTRLVLVAHNIDYDAFVTGAFVILPEYGWSLTRFYSGSGVSIYTWRKKSKTIQFVDNSNWFKGPLAEWGKVVGLPKLEVDPLTAGPEDLSRYCKRDVEILYHLWQWWYRFTEEHDLGSWGVTLPSQAFLAFRHRFMKDKIFIHNDPEVLSLERQAYHGGRTECFQVGEFTEGPFYKMDVNSMYPWAMWGFPYPTSLRGYAKEVSLKDLRYYLSKYAVIAEVSVFCDSPYFPSYREGRIVYDVGTFDTVLSTPEILIALDRGWIEKVHRIAWYTKAFIFRDYVDYFYRLKDKYSRGEDRVCYELTKLTLNSLYGKFGQLASSMELMGECDPRMFKVIPVWDPSRGRWGTEYYIGGKVWWSIKEGESYHSFPAVAAHVTAYARVYLYKLVEAAGRENVYYCDTDSLIVNQVAYERFEPFIRPNELGNFRLENVARYLYIHAPKDYVLDEEVRIKGVKKSAEWLDDHTIEQEIFPSIRGLLQKGDGETYKTHKVIKVLAREIKSGMVDNSGIVHPWGENTLL